MAERVSVNRKELEKVKNQLKNDKGLTLRQISEEIGANFKNKIYNNITFEPKTFENLKELVEREIPHEILDHRNGVSYEKRITKLERTNDFAEFVGMILGDGHIKDMSYVEDEKYVTNYILEFTFHQDDKEIINRAIKLFERCVGRTPTVSHNKNNKGVKVRLYSKDLVDLLKKHGIRPGNKTERQVSVPEWVKEDRNFQKHCLKGLTDTDGTIYVRGKEKATVVQFKNASEPLLNDFDEMCENLGIRCSKGGYRTVQVAAKEEVDRFIRLIKPIKAKGISSQ